MIFTKNPFIIKARDNDFNRRILESKKCDILLSVESGERKDNLRQIDSGLNHILAKIATKNSIAIGIDLKDLSKLEKKEKASRLAKIKQNLKICKKTKTKIALVNIKDKKSASSFLLSLGASTEQIKQALEKTISF